MEIKQKTTRASIFGGVYFVFVFFLNTVYLFILNHNYRLSWGGGGGGGGVVIIFVDIKGKLVKFWEKHLAFIGVVSIDDKENFLTCSNRAKLVRTDLHFLFFYMLLLLFLFFVVFIVFLLLIGLILFAHIGSLFTFVIFHMSASFNYIFVVFVCAVIGLLYVKSSLPRSNLPTY